MTARARAAERPYPREELPARGGGARRSGRLLSRRPLGPVARVLFLCSGNRLRSPTAEQVFAAYPGIECASAGLNHDADEPVTPELIEWADVIFVMERAHRRRLQARFRAHLRGKRVVCLDIPDLYGHMDATLVAALVSRVPRHLR